MTIDKNLSVTFNGLTATETDVIPALINTANRRCFHKPERRREYMIGAPRATAYIQNSLSFILFKPD